MRAGARLACNLSRVSVRQLDRVCSNTARGWTVYSSTWPSTRTNLVDSQFFFFFSAEFQRVDINGEKYEREVSCWLFDRDESFESFEEINNVQTGSERFQIESFTIRMVQKLKFYSVEFKYFGN